MNSDALTAPVSRPIHDSAPMLTANATKVLEARYLKKNEAGECTEKPAELFRRVARTIADVEATYGANEAEQRTWQNRFYDIMADGRFMPNSPTLLTIVLW